MAATIELGADDGVSQHEVGPPPAFTILPGDYGIKLRQAYEQRLAAQAQLASLEREQAQKASAKVSALTLC